MVCCVGAVTVKTKQTQALPRLFKDLPNEVNRLSARSYKSELEIG